MLPPPRSPASPARRILLPICARRPEQPEIPAFLKTKALIEHEFPGVQVGLQLVIPTGEAQLLEAELEALDFPEEAALSGLGVDVGEVHATVSNPTGLDVVRASLLAPRHALHLADRLSRHQDRPINVNFHLNFYVSERDAADYRARRPQHEQRLMEIGRSLCDELADLGNPRLTLTVENMPHVRCHWWGYRLYASPFDHDPRLLERFVRPARAAKSGAEAFGVLLDVAHHQLNRRAGDPELRSHLTAAELARLAEIYGMDGAPQMIAALPDVEWLAQRIEEGLITGLHLSNFVGCSVRPEGEGGQEHGTVEGHLDIDEANHLMAAAWQHGRPVTIEVTMDPKQSLRAGVFENPIRFLRLLASHPSSWPSSSS